LITRWLKKDLIHDAEYSGVGADADSQSEQREGGEAGVLAQ